MMMMMMMMMMVKISCKGGRPWPPGRLSLAMVVANRLVAPKHLSSFKNWAARCKIHENPGGFGRRSWQQPEARSQAEPRDDRTVQVSEACGAVRCGSVRCGAVRCGAVRCGAARCGVVQFATPGIWRELVRSSSCGVVWRGALWQHTVGWGHVVWCGVAIYYEV
jgi:hypothetical protein